MISQWKRIGALTGTATIALLLASPAAFALGRSKHSGYHGWSNSSSSNPSQDATGSGDEVGNTADSNPVPEPASLMLLGSALVGLGGYSGIKKRLAARK